MKTRTVKSSIRNPKHKNTLDNIKKDLVTDNFNVGKKLAWKMLSSWQAKLPEDEVLSIVGISLCEAARNYDGREETKFQTFFYYHLRGNLLREITSAVQRKRFKSGEFFNNQNVSDHFSNDSVGYCYEELVVLEQKTPEKIIEDIEEQDKFDEAFKSLDQLEKELLTRHYFNGESINNLAKSLDYCRCHLSRVKKNAISKLKSTINETEETDNIDQYRSDEYRGGRGRRKSGFDSKLNNKFSAVKIKDMMLEAASA